MTLTDLIGARSQLSKTNRKLELKMRYDMKNFIKFTKSKPSDVGHFQQGKRDEWKRERDKAREYKMQLRSVALRKRVAQ